MTDDTVSRLLLFIVLNAKTSAYQLNPNLENKSQWACHWKMVNNPNLKKHAQEAIFLRKMTKSFHPETCFNNVAIYLFRY